MIEETLFDAEEKMEKAVSVAKVDLAGVRSGRARPFMFSRVEVGMICPSLDGLTPRSESRIAFSRFRSELASYGLMITIRASGMLIEASSLKSVEKAIRESDLGVNPSNDGQIIRIIVPQLSEERRREMVKMARGKGEDARVTIRSLRRKAMDELHRIVRDGEAGEDEVTRAEKELQGVVDRYVSQIDDLVKHKEAELLEV